MCLYNLRFLYGVYRVQMVVINNASQNGLLFDKGTFILISDIYGLEAFCSVFHKINGVPRNGDSLLCLAVKV